MEAPAIITYGTTNDTDDEIPVTYEDVQGKYSYRLEDIGNFFLSAYYNTELYLLYFASLSFVDCSADKLILEEVAVIINRAIKIYSFNIFNSINRAGRLQLRGLTDCRRTIACLKTYKE